MSYIIEGVGDEVILLFLIAIIIVIIIIAWKSTHVNISAGDRNVYLVRMEDSQNNNNRRVLEVYSIDQRHLHSVNESVAPPPILNETSSTAVTTTNNTMDDRSQSGSLVINNSIVAETLESGVDSSEDYIKQTDDLECDNNDKSILATSSVASLSENLSRIRLKFLDETQRLVSAALYWTVGEFKRHHFASAVEQGKYVRLIFNGQLLCDDSRSLESYGLQADSVVHCHISNTPIRQQQAAPFHARSLLWPINNGSQNVTGNPNLAASGRNREHNGLFFSPGNHIRLIFGIKFALLWLSWIMYPQYFDYSAFVPLIVCTGTYFFFIYANRRQTPVEASSSSQNNNNASTAAS